MRRVALSLASLWLCGCFVLDEIDSGMKLMEQHSPKETKEEAPERSWGGSSKTATSPRRDSEDWWSRARSLAPGTASEASSDIVRCEVGSSVQYTSRTDCRLRGGRAATR